MARWPAATTTAVAVCALGTSVLCMLAISASAQPREVNSKFKCTDTEGKRPGCNGTCPDSCPQKCIALCPNCITYCPDQVQMVRPAIFAFGDGVLDVGNNNYLPPDDNGDPPRANHPFYGIDFPNSKPTGRFSNGYNMADFIAKSMGMDMSPPAYLSLTGPIKKDAGFTGVNYASAFSAVWYEIAMTISFSKQVNDFSTTIGQIEANMSRQEVSKLLSTSLFLISIGHMDLEYLYDRTTGHPWGPPQGFDIPRLVSDFGSVIKALYNMGARKFGIINAPPFGCRPTVVHRQYGPGGCDDVMNKLAREFNDGLKPLLTDLSSNLQGLRYSIADFYAFSDAIFMDPSAYGFMNANSSCCRGACLPQYVGLYGEPCGNRMEYWFWDEGFISEQAAKLAAAAFFDGPAQYTVPVNFKVLIEGK